MLIEFFTRETQTSSFVQDVLSSVDYSINIHSQIDLEKELSPIIIWDLDSFKVEVPKVLNLLHQNNPDALVILYAEKPELYSQIPKNLFEALYSVEDLRLHLMSKIKQLKGICNAKQIFRERMSHLVGNSESMKSLRKVVERAILHPGPVLIQGESGVGKDLVAKAIACIYDKFVTVNCSAIPDALFESELFGHTRGAFTGAQNERIGLFEDANGGAIFLDEIGDMPLHAQVKLLRVIQNKEIRPIGANKTKHIDVRIIAATNRSLRDEILEKRFREDLYFRLNVIPVHISPLRERKEDIEDLANYFIRLYSTNEGAYSLSTSALEKLQNYNWPGNIRELENIIQRALCFTDPGVLKPEDLQIDPNFSISNSRMSFPLSSQVYDTSSYDDFRNQQLLQEAEFLKQKIAENNGSVSLTAERLGMIRTALYNRLNRLGIKIKDVR